MKLGTPGFIGARLVEAREARGLTAVALANLVDVTKQAISKYENGEQGKDTPGPDVMDRICSVLNLPRTFFIRTFAPEPGPVFFRSLKSTKDIQRARARRIHGWLPLLASYTAQFIDLPEVNFPHLQMPPDPAAIAFDDIERMAVDVRRFWKLGDGPISNLVWLLENNGAVIGRESLCDEIDGLSGWHDGRPYIMLNDDKQSCARSRHDAAHELGHLLMHRGVDSSYARLPHTLKLIEDQAHRFAAAFNFPRSSFALEGFPINLDHFRDLKEKWKLSIKMMIERSFHLGFSNTHQRQRMHIAYSRRGWHDLEPLDDVLPVEQPRLFQRSIDMLIREHVQTPTDVIVRSTLGRSDVERLSCLRDRYLSSETADVVDLQPRLRSRPPSAPSVGNDVGNNVVPLRPRA